MLENLFCDKPNSKFTIVLGWQINFRVDNYVQHMLVGTNSRLGCVEFKLGHEYDH